MVRGPARPHIVSRFGTENGEPVDLVVDQLRLKLVIHVKYGIFIYLFILEETGHGNVGFTVFLFKIVIKVPH